MGIYLHLDILPGRIDPEAWAAAWDDTLRVLQGWPGGLLRLARGEVAGRPVHVYRSDIVVQRGGPETRQWKIEGDGATLRRGETHELHRDLVVFGDGGKDYDDVLLALLDDCTTTPIHNKTQGEPYHVPLLAALLVLESRFPKAVVVGGDIGESPRVMEQAIDHAESVLGWRPEPPIRTDRKRLKERLGPLLPAKSLKKAVGQLHLGPLSKQVRGLLDILLARSPTMPDLEALATLDPDEIDENRALLVQALTFGALQGLATLRQDPEQERILASRPRLPLVVDQFSPNFCLTERGWQGVERAEPEELDLMLALALAYDHGLYRHQVIQALLENAALRRRSLLWLRDPVVQERVEEVYRLAAEEKQRKAEGS